MKGFTKTIYYVAKCSGQTLRSPPSPTCICILIHLSSISPTRNAEINHHEMHFTLYVIMGWLQCFSESATDFQFALIAGLTVRRLPPTISFTTMPQLVTYIHLDHNVSVTCVEQDTQDRQRQINNNCVVSHLSGL